MESQNQYPPYPPTTAALGGVPTIPLDVPITTIFLLLFIIGAVCHMTIFTLNRKRGHKFIMSGMMFGFCMSRIVTMIMRIVWSVYPKNVRVAIAANIFVAAGIVLLFVVNLIFAQRILRASHPHFGWHPIVHYGFIAIYVTIVVTLIMLITAVIQSFYTLNGNTKRIDRDIQLYGQTFYAIISFLPIPLVIIGFIIPRKQNPEKFGIGRWRHKISILLVSTVLLCLGASFRVGANYAGGTRPASDPAGYQSKACFYLFNFTVEVAVITLYIVVRVDKRFHVPDGSHGAGDYLRQQEDLRVKSRGESKFEQNIAPEEEVFDGMSAEEVAEQDTLDRATDEEKGINGHANRDGNTIP